MNKPLQNNDLPNYIYDTRISLTDGKHQAFQVSFTPEPNAIPEGDSTGAQANVQIAGPRMVRLICSCCQKPFDRLASLHRHNVSIGVRLCCSRSCSCRLGNSAPQAKARSAAVARAVLPWKKVGGASKQEKLAANGLINMRIKRGLMERPKACEQCGKSCRPDAHHEDYSKPDVVEFLCRSCHAKRHRQSA